MITHTTNKCKDCGREDSIVTNFSAGQVECKACGAVLEDRIIDETYEGRNFGNENQTSGKDQTRVGGPLNPYAEKSDLSVNFVSKRNGDIPSKSRHRSNGGQSSIQKIINRANVLAQKINLSNSIISRAHDLLDDVKNAGKLKGRSLDYIIASVFYFACRQERVPKKLSKISEELELNNTIVNKCFNTIKDCIVKQPDDLNNTVIYLVKECCKNFISKNNESSTKYAELRTASLEICDLICKKEVIAGRNPSTVAGASVLIASKLLEMKIGKREIAKEMTTTENTISNAYNKLMEYKKHIIPEKYNDKIHLLD